MMYPMLKPGSKSFDGEHTKWWSKIYLYSFLSMMAGREGEWDGGNGKIRHDLSVVLAQTVELGLASKKAFCRQLGGLSLISHARTFFIRRQRNSLDLESFPMAQLFLTLVFIPSSFSTFDRQDYLVGSADQQENLTSKRILFLSCLRFWREKIL